jgi:hypothetical protein
MSPLIYFLVLFCVHARGEILDSEPQVSTRPLVELAIAGGFGYVPDYPAARQGRLRYLVFPSMFLRGRTLRNDDEDGSRARIFNDPRFALELSASGSFPVDSGDNRARYGMPDLEWLGELGPRLFYSVYSDAKNSWRTSFTVRAAVSTDTRELHYRGLTLTPAIAYDRKQVWGEHLYLSLRLAPEFASRELQSYFYSVSEHDATADRPFYSANAGYMETWFSASIGYEKDRYGFYAGGGIDYHEGAANQASPLFKERVTFAGFAGFRYFFYKSEAHGYL